jgi:hypothetical protein
LPQAARPASNANVSAKCDTRIVIFSQEKPPQYRCLEDQTGQVSARQTRHLAAALAATERFV